MDKYKKFAFNYWDKFGPKRDKFLYNFIGLDDNNRYTLPFDVYEWLVEWYGGSEGINRKIRQYSGKLIIAQSYNMGSYDFEFKPKNLIFMDNQIQYDGVIIGEGIVDINNGTYEFDNILDAIQDEDIGWEVKDEVVDIMNETLSLKIEGVEIGEGLRYYCRKISFTQD